MYPPAPSLSDFHTPGPLSSLGGILMAISTSRLLFWWDQPCRQRAHSGAAFGEEEAGCSGCPKPPRHRRGNEQVFQRQHNPDSDPWTRCCCCICCLLNRGWTHHPPTRLLRPLLPRLARQKERLLLPLQQKQQKEGLLLQAPWRADLLPSLLALPCQSRQGRRLIHLRLFRARQEVDLFLSFQGREEESLNRLRGP